MKIKPLLITLGCAMLSMPGVVFAPPPATQPPQHPPPQTTNGHRGEVKELQVEPNRLPIPPGFFDPGSMPFDGTVRLGGAGGGPDTVVRRLWPADPLTAPVDIELVSLSLVSVAPIVVTPHTPDKEVADKVQEKLK